VRHRRRAAACAFAAFALVAALACTTRDDGRARRQATHHVFGTLATLDVRADSARDADAAIATAMRMLATRHRQWHAWEPSELTALNARVADGTEALVPDALAPLFAASLPMVAASDGAFDPAAGALIARWGFHTSDYPVAGPAPDPAELTGWRTTHRRLDAVTVDGKQIAAGARVQFDFNAIAEGVASAEVMATLAAAGVEHALLDLGGDVTARGDAGGRAWRVALRDPLVDGALAWVELGDGESLFASGGYAKYRSEGSQRWPHVLDPRTGQPARGAIASAVLARDPARADATATALMVVGAEGMPALLERAQLSCALVVDAAGLVHATPSMAERLRDLREDRPLERTGSETARCD
jgi:thiamine biosynthesis lipoprotein